MPSASSTGEPTCFEKIVDFCGCAPGGDQFAVTKALRGLLVKDEETGRSFDITTLMLHPNPSRPLKDSYKTFNTKDMLGSGSFGTVWKATVLGGSAVGEVRAVKVVSKTAVNTDMKFVVREVEAMVKLLHPNIVKFFEFFENRQAIFLVTELCNCGDFGEFHANHHSRMEMRLLFRDIFLGVAYCHSLNIAHRDLKFENALITEEKGATRRVAKVIDFGLASIKREGDREKFARESLGDWTFSKQSSTTLGPSLVQHRCGKDQWQCMPGTKYFVAPEVVTGKDPRYGVKCDLWSLGIMMYISLTDEHPVHKDADRMDTKQLFRLVRQGKVRQEPLTTGKVSIAAETLIKGLLVAAPEKRLSAAESLEMDWLKPHVSNEHQPEPGTVGDRLTAFGMRSRFDKVVLTLTAHQANEKQVKDLKDLFFQLDTNANGLISKDELRRGLEQCLAHGSMKKDAVEAVYHSLDTNADGTVNYTEWLSGTLEPSVAASDKVIKDLFRYFDVDRTNSISAEELRTVLGDEEALNVLRLEGKSGDGQISYDEFAKLLKEIPWRENHYKGMSPTATR